jgi:hypothetical protein
MVLALYTEHEEREYGIYLLFVAMNMSEYLVLFSP